MSRKLERRLRPLLGRLGWVPILQKVAWTEAYLLAKCHLHPSSTFATINMGRFFFLGGGSAPFLGRGAESPSNTKSVWSRPNAIPRGILVHAAIWPQQIWAENWGLCPFGGGELGSHLTQCVRGRGLRACQLSFVLIHPAAWPQCTNVTDRQDRQTADR